MHALFDFTTFFWLMVIASIVAMLGRFLKIPYALALVITGLAVGFAQILPGVVLEPKVLFMVFLPPLLFESALNIRLQDLRFNWKPVSLYAIAGTMMSVFLVGFLVHYLLDIPLAAALVFGALIAPTDPISVIAIFKQLGVGKRLSLLMEAESLFNDGVAVVVFGLLAGAALGEPVGILSGFQTFLIVALGGAAVGSAIGYAASYITGLFDDHLLEIMLTTVVAFGSYLAAETVHMSGVIAVVSAGLVIGNYGTQTGMSPTTRLAVNSFWEYAAFVVNSVVFLLVGLEITVIDLTGAIPIIAISALVVIGARAASIYLLSPLLGRHQSRVPLRWQHVLFWGALKGALPMALVLGLSGDFPYRSQLLYMTFGVVVISLLLQGLTMKRLLVFLGLTGGRDQMADYRRFGMEILACEAAIDELERLCSQKAVSTGIRDQLAGEYRQRINRLESGMHELACSDPGFEGNMLQEARSLALAAEKTSLLESRSRGLIQDEDLAEIMQRLDSQLEMLTSPHFSSRKPDSPGQS